MNPPILIAAALLCATPSAADDERPSIVVILADDLGWRDLACYGSDLHRTPRLDQLATEGVRFTHSYAAASVCSPTRASILTGKYPARLHLTDYIPGGDDGPLRAPAWRRILEPGQPTIASLLADAGYATGHFGKWHLNRDKHYAPDRPGDPASHGFETVLTTVRPGDNDPPTPDAHHAARITDAAIEFLHATRDRPALCFVSHHLVHLPLRAEEIDPLPDPPPALHRNPTYAAMVAELDRQVGRLLDALDETGRGDSLVIFTSDNGGTLGPTSNAPLRGGKGTAYEGGIRVPTIIRRPGRQRTGTVSNTPIISNDFLPTICAAAGVRLARNARHDGRNLLPLLLDPHRPLDRVALHWHYPHYHALGARPHSAIRVEDWKLIEFLEDGRLELYDLDADPGERHNLVSEHPHIARLLQVQLQGWRTSVDAQSPRPALAPKVLLAVAAFGALLIAYVLVRTRRAS